MTDKEVIKALEKRTGEKWVFIYEYAEAHNSDILIPSPVRRKTNGSL